MGVARDNCQGNCLIDVGQQLTHQLQQLTHQYTCHCLHLGALCAGCLQAEAHQLSRANAALTAENMQMKHELQQAHSTQQQLIASKQVAP